MFKDLCHNVCGLCQSPIGLDKSFLQIHAFQLSASFFSPYMCMMGIIVTEFKKFRICFNKNLDWLEILTKLANLTRKSSTSK